MQHVGERPAATIDVASSSEARPSAKDFSLVLGGPLYQLFLKTRLARPPLELLRRRVLALVGITWLPPALFAALEGRLVSGPLPFLFDLANLQFFTTVPMLLWAEVIIHRRLRQLVPEFVERDLVAEEDRARFDDAISRALRLRSSLLPEISLLVLALIGGHWLWRTHAWAPTATWYLVPVDGSTELTAAGSWLAFVSLPISRFLLLRWYFRWLTWSLFLWRVSRLRLRLNPLHGDRAGGLAFLEQSATGFTQVLLAQSTYVALSLGNRIWHQGARLADFGHQVGALVALLAVLALVPQTFFAKQMVEARRSGLVRYGRFASRYTNAFHDKWLATGETRDPALLGTSDIQSLADLDNSYDVVRKMRAVPFDKVLVMGLVLTVALPFFPLVLTMVPLDALIAALANIIV